MIFGADFVMYLQIIALGFEGSERMGENRLQTGRRHLLLYISRKSRAFLH